MKYLDLFTELLQKYLNSYLFSLVETTKQHGLELYAYLREVFTKLPRATTVEAIEALLPGNIRP